MHFLESCLQNCLTERVGGTKGFDFVQGTDIKLLNLMESFSINNL